MEPAHPCKCWTPLRAHRDSSWMLCRGESKEAETPASDSSTFSQQSCCQHTHKIPLFLKPSRLFPRCPFRSLGQMLTRLLLTPFAAKFQRGLLLLLLLKEYKLGYLKRTSQENLDFNPCSVLTSCVFLSKSLSFTALALSPIKMWTEVPSLTRGS